MFNLLFMGYQQVLYPAKGFWLFRPNIPNYINFVSFTFMLNTSQPRKSDRLHVHVFEFSRFELRISGFELRISVFEFDCSTIELSVANQNQNVLNKVAICY